MTKLFYRRKSFTHWDGMPNSTIIGFLLQTNTENIWVGIKLTQIIKTACFYVTCTCNVNLIDSVENHKHVKTKTIFSGFMEHLKKQ